MLTWPDPKRWGAPPWSISRGRCAKGIPRGEDYDIAVIGAGFTGLATACESLRRERQIKVVVLERGRVGDGAGGRTGGIALDGTAAGPMRGFEGCLAGLSRFLEEEKTSCDLNLNGCWEVGRTRPWKYSPIAWADSGTVRVKRMVQGGSLDPGAFLTGLLRSCRDKGADVRESATVEELEAKNGWILLRGKSGQCRAQRVAVAADAPILDLFGKNVRPYNTLALATEPLSASLLSEIGWSSQTPFYTVDFPYLWGRLTSDRRAVIGSGLIGFDKASRLGNKEPRALLADLEARVRGLHPALSHVRITHRWAGPISLTRDFRPKLTRWKECRDVAAAAGYCGHGVALSVRMARILAGALLSDEPLPPNIL